MKWIHHTDLMPPTFTLYRGVGEITQSKTFNLRRKVSEHVDASELNDQTEVLDKFAHSTIHVKSDVFVIKHMEVSYFTSKIIAEVFSSTSVKSIHKECGCLV